MLGEGGLDEDMKEMLKEELSEAKSAKEELEEKIKILLLLKIQTMIKILSWKFVAQQVVMKQPFCW